jgi:broad specificity phosphatase PhoE
LDLVFVRHGESEHTLDLPRSLGLVDPKLTDQGCQQVTRLRSTIAISDADIIVASPTRRTLETAILLSDTTSAARYTSPAVGPRMFPQHLKDSPLAALACDQLLDRDVIARNHPTFGLLSNDDDLWREGINTVAHEKFKAITEDFLGWCRDQKKERVIIVAHDGTIHSYRQLLGEQGLTRGSFLGDAGWHRLTA